MSSSSHFPRVSRLSTVGGSIFRVQMPGCIKISVLGEHGSSSLSLKALVGKREYNCVGVGGELSVPVLSLRENPVIMLYNNVATWACEKELKIMEIVERRTLDVTFPLGNGMEVLVRLQFTLSKEESERICQKRSSALKKKQVPLPEDIQKTVISRGSLRDDIGKGARDKLIRGLPWHDPKQTMNLSAGKDHPRSFPSRITWSSSVGDFMKAAPVESSPESSSSNVVKKLIRTLEGNYSQGNYSQKSGLSSDPQMTKSYSAGMLFEADVRTLSKHPNKLPLSKQEAEYLDQNTSIPVGGSGKLVFESNLQQNDKECKGLDQARYAIPEPGNSNSHAALTIWNQRLEDVSATQSPNFGKDVLPTVSAQNSRAETSAAKEESVHYDQCEKQGFHEHTLVPEDIINHFSQLYNTQEPHHICVTTASKTLVLILEKFSLQASSPPCDGRLDCIVDDDKQSTAEPSLKEGDIDQILSRSYVKKHQAHGVSLDGWLLNQGVQIAIAAIACGVMFSRKQ